MTLDARSRLAGEMADLAKLLASSTELQNRFGEAGNPVLAAERIYFGAKVTVGPDTGGVGGNVSIDDQGLSRPYAIVLRPPGPLWMQAAAGEQNWLLRSGVLWLYLTDNSKIPTNQQDDAIDFANFAGLVEEHLALSAGRDDSLAINSIDLIFGPRSTAPNRVGSQGKWWEVLYQIAWS